MLAAIQPAGLGRSWTSRGKWACGCVGAGREPAADTQPVGGSSSDLGVMEPSLRGCSGSEAGGRDAAEGRVSRAGLQLLIRRELVRAVGGSRDRAGLCRAGSFNKTSLLVMPALSPFIAVYR